MVAHIQYKATLRQKLYGVHVTGLTKDEAYALLSGAATIQEERDGHAMSAFDRAEFTGEVECPERLDEPTWLEKYFGWLFAFWVLVLATVWLTPEPTVRAFMEAFK